MVVIILFASKKMKCAKEEENERGEVGGEKV